MNIRKEVLKRKDSLVNDLVGWVKKKSVYDESTITKGAPFGKGVKNSLDYIAKLAKKQGFKVTNYDGYCVEIEYGKGDEIIGIFGHADVVPEGKGWIHKPYGGEIEKNLIYGRGSSDDKGPTLCSLYAMKILKDNGIEPNKTIRLIVGGNEESGSKCLEYYFHKLKKPHPTYGFSPDADFPLIYAEKGIFTYEYYGKYKDNLISYMDAGVASNAVPSSLEVHFNKTVKFDEKFVKLCNKLNLKYEFDSEKETKKVVFYGKAAHAAKPELGVNALSLGLYVLSKTTESELAKHYGPILSCYYGKKVGINHVNKEMGPLTFNVGIGKYDGKAYSLICNMRYPKDMNHKEIAKLLDKTAMHKGRILSNSDPLYINPKTPFIKVLLDSYAKVTKIKNPKPITIGGGTYARETINTVAFGMDFARNNGTGNIHDVEEAINIKDLVDGTHIYTEALIGLLNL